MKGQPSLLLNNSSKNRRNTVHQNLVLSWHLSVSSLSRHHFCMGLLQAEDHSQSILYSGKKNVILVHIQSLDLCLNIRHGAGGWGAFSLHNWLCLTWAPCEHSLLYCLTKGDTVLRDFLAGFGCRWPGAEFDNETSVSLAWARGTCLTVLQQIVLSAHQQTL